MKKLKNVNLKSKEELLELAKSENVEVSDDEINALLKSTATNRELSDEELENVTGVHVIQVAHMKS